MVKNNVTNHIAYTAGSHGQFLKYLFDCYEKQELLPHFKNTNGNSHDSINVELKTNTFAYDLCNAEYEKRLNLVNNQEKLHRFYSIVWYGIDNFCYVLQCMHDRGGRLQENGINLMQSNMERYIESFGFDVKTSHKENFKDLYNVEIEKNKQVPNFVLRQYFILSFITYFNHINWKKNEQLLKKQNFAQINIELIFDYNKLQSYLDKIFSYHLNFKSVHDKFIEYNVPLKNMSKIKSVLEAINNKQDIKISNLDFISEAYVLYYLEKMHYDIPFINLNTFFTSTSEIFEYIKYFPNYLKKPNNLFLKYHKIYNKKR